MLRKEVLSPEWEPEAELGSILVGADLEVVAGAKPMSFML